MNPYPNIPEEDRLTHLLIHGNEDLPKLTDRVLLLTKVAGNSLVLACTEAARRGARELGAFITGGRYVPFRESSLARQRRIDYEAFAPVAEFALRAHLGTEDYRRHLLDQREVLDEIRRLPIPPHLQHL